MNAMLVQVLHHAILSFSHVVFLFVLLCLTADAVHSLFLFSMAILEIFKEPGGFLKPTSEHIEVLDKIGQHLMRTGWRLLVLVAVYLLLMTLSYVTTSYTQSSVIS